MCRWYDCDGCFKRIIDAGPCDCPLPEAEFDRRKAQVKRLETEWMFERAVFVRYVESLPKFEPNLPKDPVSILVRAMRWVGDILTAEWFVVRKPPQRKPLRERDWIRWVADHYDVSLKQEAV